MMTQQIFQLIDQGDVDGIRRLLDSDSMLVHARHVHPELFHWTTLQYAAAEGKLAVCQLLVERGAEVYTNPMNTYPPVIQAAWKGHQNVVDYFLQEIPEKADGTNQLGVTINLAARQGWIDIVRKHLERDRLSVFQRGWIGDSPLHWPAHNGYADIVEMLLDAGAEIDADETNCYGGKPLHWASEHEPSTVAVLLKRGADVNARNVKKDSEFYGVTPLIMNASQKEDCAEVTSLLLESGADKDAVDAKGWTALDHAKKQGNRRIESVLNSV